MARHFGMGEETSWNSGGTVYAFMEALSESVRKEIAFENIETIRTNSVRDVVELNTVIRGDVEIIGNYQDFGVLAYFLLGSTDTTGVGPYTHTAPASTGIATRPPLRLEIKRDSDALTWRYDGCKLTGLRLSASVDQAARVGLSFIGASESTGSATSASFPTLNPILSKEVTISFDNGSTTVDAQSLDFTIEYGADEPRKLGSTTLAVEPQDMLLSVTGSATVLFTDTTEYAYYDGTNDTDIQILCDTGGDETLTINMNNCRMTQATPSLSGRDRLTATYEWVSYFDATATENIQIITVNDDADVTA